MALIPLLCYIDGKLRAEVAMCTEEQFKHYIEENIMPKHYLQTDFLEKFLSEKTHLNVKDIRLVSEELAEFSEKYVFGGSYPRFISIEDVKKLLVQANIDYSTFIDEYAEYLKII